MKMLKKERCLAECDYLGCIRCCSLRAEDGHTSHQCLKHKDKEQRRTSKTLTPIEHEDFARKELKRKFGLGSPYWKRLLKKDVLNQREAVHNRILVLESILHGLTDELKAIRLLLSAAGSSKKEEQRRHMDRTMKSMGKHLRQRLPKRMKLKRMRNLRGLKDGEWI